MQKTGHLGVKALILAGGRGKRLKPITDYVPKPLVPINNIPIIEWQINYFKKFNVKEFVICAGYKNEQIINYLKSRNLAVKIHYSVEKMPLGTGGAIKNACKFINEKNFFVINGDVITNLDLAKLTSKINSVATIPLRTAYGIIKMEKTKITKFQEKPQITGYWMNAGVYYLSKEILSYLPTKGNIENTAFPIFAERGCLHAVKYPKAFWYSIDSHKDIEECAKTMQLIRYNNFLFKK